MQGLRSTNNFSSIRTRTKGLLLLLSADEPEPGAGGIGLCGLLLTGVSWIIVIVTLPFSLCVCFKVGSTTT